MFRHFIHKVSIVTDDDKHSIKFGKIFFQRSQRIKVYVIRLEHMTTGVYLV